MINKKKVFLIEKKPKPYIDNVHIQGTETQLGLM